MDLYPLLNSIRISAIASAITFIAGMGAAYGLRRLPAALKALADCVLTLPLVLPPTVTGFFLLKLLSPRGPVGAFFYDRFGLKLAMTWPAAIAAVVAVTFPLMYRAARSAFESFDPGLSDAGRSLGLNGRQVFWRITIPCCRRGLAAGFVLAFVRGLGEYGATSMVAGYVPGKTATVSTTVYQLWREGSDALAYRWVAVNIVISLAALIVLNYFEKGEK